LSFDVFWAEQLIAKAIRSGKNLRFSTPPGVFADDKVSNDLDGWLYDDLRVFHAGNVKEKADPFPGWLCTQIRPPRSSMNFRDRASPSPVRRPPARRRRRASPAQGWCNRDVWYGSGAGRHV